MGLAQGSRVLVSNPAYAYRFRPTAEDGIRRGDRVRREWCYRGADLELLTWGTCRFRVLSAPDLGINLQDLDEADCA